MLSPKRVKWRKQHRNFPRGQAARGAKLHKGEFGLQAMEVGRLTSRQIEAARIAMTRYTKRGGEIWIRVFPHKPVTKKPAETRMGSGKGGVEYWAAQVRPGRLIYEMAGISEAQAREALRLASHKLGIKTRFVSKDLEKLHAEEAAKKRAEEAQAKVADAGSAG